MDTFAPDEATPFANEEALTGLEPQPEEVLAMGRYLGIGIDRGEQYLLSVAREAVAAPVLAPWQEMEDAQGNPYFYNHRTKESTRRHPLDTKFLHLVAEMRQLVHPGAPDDRYCRTWMAFEGGEEGSYFYNFMDGRTSTEQPPAQDMIEPVPREMLPVYDTESFGVNLDVPGGVPSTRPVIRPDLVNRDGVVRELVFKSWWSEDKEEPSLGNNMIAGGGLKKRYITIKFDIYAQTFKIHLDNEEAVSLFNLMSVTAKNGLPIQCWDLHVGAKLNMLGKTTTLMQGDLATLNWLEKHNVRLRGIKAALERDLKKYETRALAAAVTFTKGPNTKGGTSLRALMEQIEKLCATLAQFRPSLARKYASQAAQPP